ncbi:putative methyltransferase Cher3 (plasmid) [Caballeronia sp. S22]
MNGPISQMNDGRHDEEATFDIELKLILEAIYLRYQHDFRHYSVSSLRRRLAQAVHDFGVPTLSHLQERILRDPALFARLFQYLTVQVSEMFRDPQYFRAIREQVVPILQTYPSIKVWVAGCSSGEELWSLAVLFAEEKIADRTVFYATDINAEALRQAESGIYPLERMAGFSQNYLAAGGKRSLSDYYHAAYGAAKFSQTLKSRVVFADHSLATDSVFLEAHLVSCRNVLIYFDRALQDRALGLFSDSLVRRGFLGLGSKESLRFSTYADRFADFNPRERLYQKV